MELNQSATTAVADQPTGDVRREVEGRKRPSTSSRGPYEYFLMVISALFAAISIYFVGSILAEAWSTFQQQGLYFFTGSTWLQGGDGLGASQYGAYPMIMGTILTSGLALLLAGGLGLFTALALNFFLPVSAKTLVSTLIELLAAVPSIVYGMWGILVLGPIMENDIGPWLNNHFPFGGTIFGEVIGPESLGLAALVLAVMILPTFVAISREVLSAVPHELTEASLSLGATKWQTLARTVIPTARIGIVGAAGLALGRALGETIAVTLLAGNSNFEIFKLNHSGTTLASWIANNFGEAQGDQVNALYALGAVLMVMSLGITLISRWMVARQRRAAAV